MDNPDRANQHRRRSDHTVERVQQIIASPWTQTIWAAAKVLVGIIVTLSCYIVVTKNDQYERTTAELVAELKDLRKLTSDWKADRMLIDARVLGLESFRAETLQSRERFIADQSEVRARLGIVEDRLRRAIP